MLFFQQIHPMRQASIRVNMPGTNAGESIRLKLTLRVGSLWLIGVHSYDRDSVQNSPWMSVQQALNVHRKRQMGGAPAFKDVAGATRQNFNRPPPAERTSAAAPKLPPALGAASPFMYRNGNVTASKNRARVVAGGIPAVDRITFDLAIIDPITSSTLGRLKDSKPPTANWRGTSVLWVTKPKMSPIPCCYDKT